ncbi:MAG: DUF4418 family protein [Nitrospirae bacterium]|nr:DUF4418 family protein [Nitrospirota bacterium]MBI5696642.1 DUF4418 family protein [Nitrospirota bacterium]
MSGRKKTVNIIVAIEASLALLVVLVPRFVFPVCEAPMHCYYSYMAEIGTAAVIIAASAASVAAKGLEAPRMLSVPAFVAGVFVILYPSYLIGICGSPQMACHYGTMPVWNLLGGGILLLSAAVFFMAREESV